MNINATSLGDYLYQIDASTSFLIIPIISLAIVVAVMSSIQQSERKGNLHIPFISALLFGIGLTISENGYNPNAIPSIAVLIIATIISVFFNINEKYGD